MPYRSTNILIMNEYASNQEPVIYRRLNYS